MHWRRLVPSFGLVMSLALFAVAGLIGIRFLLIAINDGKCRARCSVSLAFVGPLEDYRRVKGSYPVATDVATLKSTLRGVASGSERIISEAQILFESDGSTYRLALFPNDYESAGGYCGCLLLADRKIVSFPAALSANSRERLATTLESTLREHRANDH
jgi:hypothetical protein